MPFWRKIFTKSTILNFLYIVLLICSFLFIPKYNIKTGYTEWSLAGLGMAQGPVNVGALIIQRVLTLALLIFYLYNLKVQKKIKQENIEIDFAIKESEDRRHHVEREYFKLRRQMQEIFDAMTDLVYMCSKDYKIEFMNKALKKVFGHAVGRKCYEVFYNRIDPCPWCVNDRVFKGEFVEWTQKHPILKRTYRIHNSPFIHPDGTVSKVAVIHDITDIEQSHNILKKSEEHFRNLFENLPIACIGYDKDGNIVAWNKEATRLYGFSKEEAVGRSMFETIARNKNREKGMQIIKEIFQGRALSGLEMKDVHSDGTFRRVYTNTYPLRDMQGNITMGISANIDITSFKTIERDLESSNEHLEKIMETPNSLIIELDRDLVIKRFNRGCEEATGYLRAEVLGKKWIDIFVPERLKGATKEMLKDIIAQDISILQRQHESSIITRNGKEKVIFWSHTNIYDENEDFVSLIAIGDDITDRKRFQQRMSEAEGTLKESEERFRQVAESAEEWIWEVDTDGMYTYASHIVEKILGYKAEELIGKKHFYDLFVPQNREELKKAAFEVFSKKEPFKDFVNLNVHKNGNIVVLQTSGTPILNDKGKLVGYRGVDADITERKKAEEEVRRSEEVLRSMSDNSPDIIMMVDLNGTLQFINRTLPYLTKEEVTGKSIFDYITKKDEILIMKECFKRVLKTGKQDTYYNEFQLPDGQVIYFESRVSPIVSNGSIVAFIINTTDITTRKKFRDQFLESKEKYESLVMNLELGVFRTTPSPEGEFLEVNPAFVSMFGYKNKKELVKQHVRDIYYYSAERASFVEEIAKKGSLRKELLFRKKDGSPFWAELFVKAVKDENGKTLFFDGILKDITFQKEMQERQREIRERLEAIALKDPLTGLYNAKYIHERLFSEFERAKRSLRSLSLILLDLDYFKSINETHGHNFGDKVLIQVAKLLRSELRMNDVVARWGGEEFIVILPEINRKEAVVVAEKILQIFKKKGFGDEKILIHLKCSIGVASYPEDSIFSPEEMLEAVDKSLFKVKGEGGDGIGFFHEDIGKVKTEEEAPQEKLLDSIKEKLSFFAVRSEQSILEAIYSLSKSLELKDHSTRKHAEKMVHYAVQLARYFKMNDEETEDVRRATILHDIGKLGVPDEILLKSGPLTKSEFEIVKKHPKIAAEVMAIADFLKDSIPYVLHHHEHYDGTGYPDGLKGEQIPFGARIVAVVDTYDAIMSDRPYHKALSKNEAILVLKNDSGRRLDPKIVNVFIKLLKKEEKES